MTDIDLTLNPVDNITVDAIGKPGSRVFYVQGTKGDQVVSLLIEKVQLQSLIMGINDFLDEIADRYKNLQEIEADFREEEMRIRPPVDPLFRVGDMGLAYDETDDRVCIIAKESPGGSEENSEKDEGGIVRYWCTRTQLLAMANWAMSVVQRGRPICPQCGEPMEPEGHFCPKKNGHKKNTPLES